MSQNELVVLEEERDDLLEKNGKLRAENDSLRAECIRITPFAATSDPIKAADCEAAWKAWLSGKGIEVVKITRVPAYTFMSGWASGAATLSDRVWEVELSAAKDRNDLEAMKVVVALDRSRRVNAEAEVASLKAEAGRWKKAREESENCIAHIVQAAGARPDDKDIVQHVATLRAEQDALAEALRDLLAPFDALGVDHPAVAKARTTLARLGAT